MNIYMSCLVKVPGKNTVNVRHVKRIDDAKLAAVVYFNNEQLPQGCHVYEKFDTEFTEQKACEMNDMNYADIEVFIYGVIVSDDNTTTHLVHNDRTTVMAKQNQIISIQSKDDQKINTYDNVYLDCYKPSIKKSIG